MKKGFRTRRRRSGKQQRLASSVRLVTSWERETRLPRSWNSVLPKFERPWRSGVSTSRSSPRSEFFSSLSHLFSLVCSDGR